MTEWPVVFLVNCLVGDCFYSVHRTVIRAIETLEGASLTNAGICAGTKKQETTYGGGWLKPGHVGAKTKPKEVIASAISWYSTMGCRQTSERQAEKEKKEKRNEKK